jgi:uncharacterized LabA/DUF88 family protein
MRMKIYLLIDGENLVHSIVRTLESHRLIHSRDDLKRIDTSILLQALPQPPTVIHYYTTRIHELPQSSSLFKSVEKMRRWNSYWVPYLANQGVQFIKAGILKVRDTKTCVRCGHVAEVLLEKGVDVRLGVDIVSLAEPATTLYVLSSDSDLIPAVLNARRRGARVIYVAIADAINHAISKSASETVVLSAERLIDAYRKANP